jgi:stage V sporulation protein B
MESMASIFMALSQLTTGVLQTIGKQYYVTIYVVNIVLLSNPDIHIYGITISTTICYMIYTILNLIAIKRLLKVKIEWK